ncbi:hypothetical protein MZO42_12640 [Sphingomonas psychrotolerans]|uniref:DUF6968 domain-containing protein n=1 Tax=Sphingomonas psychrotolerans TaxID=1327635 RepID=A0ABU3N5I7_9SPHN|nr:hypothetical protein [Sphingomonas psychrotolerans]MDT8759546.1 hypothetical protein [Sphingomonas psychrotolerans]
MPSDVGDVIASRIFERDDGVVELRFHKPEPYPDPELDADPGNPPWRCLYTIGFPDGETVRGSAVGIDSVQALLLVFASAKRRLCHVGDGTAARRPPLRWLGEIDLGLSIVHFE